MKKWKKWKKWKKNEKKCFAWNWKKVYRAYVNINLKHSLINTVLAKNPFFYHGLAEFFFAYLCLPNQCATCALASNKDNFLIYQYPWEYASDSSWELINTRCDYCGKISNHALIMQIEHEGVSFSHGASGGSNRDKGSRWTT